MKKVLRIILMLLLVIIVAIAGLLIYVKAALPDVGPPPDITVEITPERLERGEYLAHQYGCAWIVIRIVIGENFQRRLLQGRKVVVEMNIPAKWDSRDMITPQTSHLAASVTGPMAKYTGLSPAG